MESLENQLRQFEAEIAERMKPTAEEIVRMRKSLPADAPLPPSPREEAIRLWMELPGIGLTTASSMVAELGVNMEQFPSSGHLASWAALCPGNNESAGKRMSGKTRKGNVWLRRTMCEAAGCGAQQEDLLCRSVRADCGSAGQETRADRCRPQPVGSCLRDAQTQETLPELGSDFFEDSTKTK